MADPDIGKEVFVNCRVQNPCKGQRCQIVMKFPLPEGGTSIRYRCLSCKGSFHITL